jgi:hypothetical protein
MDRFDWQEPAHMVLVRHYEDLVAIHRVIRDKFQSRIDEAFDRASKEIGWVVAMTFPVRIVAAKGKVRSVEPAAASLRGTLFERGMAPVLAEVAKAGFPALEGGEPLAADPTPEPASVAYDFRLIWANALRVRFRTEWLEPAHIRPWLEPAHVGQPWLEPAHWILDPHPDPWRQAFAPWKERVLLSVLDEVYPELQLMARVTEVKAMVRARRWHVGPGIPEPAHVDPSQRLDPRLLAELVRAVRRRVPVVPEVEEPAHLADWARRLTPELIKELDAVLKKYGM